MTDSLTPPVSGETYRRRGPEQCDDCRRLVMGLDDHECPESAAKMHTGDKDDNE